MKSLGNLAIAVAVAGGLFVALILAEANLAGLDLGGVKYVMPMVLGTGLYTGLNRRAGNRRMPVANDARKAELLAFPPYAGGGWIVVMRDKNVATAALGFDVSVDDRGIAQLMPKRFTLVAVPAGTHRLLAEVPGAPGDFTVTPLNVAVAPGEILIFAIRSSMGVMRSSLRFDPVADTPAARAALVRMQLVEAQG
ncbi:hypothetical protein [Sphingomonas sp. KR3-1]|uniref:hypothetical protein n=1 Tax=Sphingomonas sp. KR3-1 TaxID=3156611 RepID=UPI0032B3BD9C